MTFQLPAKANLENLKNQAKTFLRALKTRDSAALNDLAHFHPNYRGKTDGDLLAKDLALADAQLVIARKHGCRTWASLKTAVQMKKEIKMQSERPDKTQIGSPVPELPVKDVVKAQEYYRDVLGYDIAWTYPDKRIGAVNRGESAIFLSYRKKGFQPCICWIFANDVDATYEELKSAGANIVDDIENKVHGLRQFTIEDIDGNRFHIHHDN